MKAARKGAEGFVKLGFSIDIRGGVQDIVVLDSKPANLFEKEAIRALKKWKFAPAKKNGRAYTPAVLVEVIKFKLNDDEDDSSEDKQLAARKALEASEQRALLESQYCDYLQRVKGNWLERRTSKYQPGDTICTFYNSYGFVEQDLGDRAKVILLGKLGDQYESGFFFGGTPFEHFKNYGEKVVISSKSEQKTTWVDKDQIATCSFQERI
ncbi:hypothetical protein GCM10007894_14840 [Paraferrimonas haliotis]|uniref:Protein TonB n=2 Tax=Paraferrimonas haliotis TaxID=2013866 RepID=A0AA37WWH3_9GAMM|nr:hypothetical protein GCM10007894_14840 [Paraferrimonas haliotis]